MPSLGGRTLEDKPSIFSRVVINQFAQQLECNTESKNNRSAHAQFDHGIRESAFVPSGPDREASTNRKDTARSGNDTNEKKRTE